MMQDYGSTKVVQVTNIAPQATRDQMHTLFSHLGKIEDLRLYPSMRDASVNIQSRVCFLKFIEDTSLPVSLHMTNTVFIDRAIIVQPFMNGDIPDELSGLEFANASGGQRGETRLPPHVFNDTNDEGMMITKDENLAQTGLPPFPPLPPETEMKACEEIRRTVMVWGIGMTTSAQEVMDYFANGAGEVKYFRWCGNKPELAPEGEEENVRTALMEFSDYGAVMPAMRLNNTVLGENTIKLYYSSQAITKPQAKSNEAALKEIEEAMKKVKEAQNLVTAAVDPLMGMLGVKGKASRSRSRTPSRSRDYYSRDRHSGRRRSRSRDRDRRRSRSRRRSRDRRRSRSRGKRSRSKDKRRSKSKKRSRSRSKDRKKDSKKEEVKKEVKKEDVKEVDAPVTEANGTAELAAVKVETDTNGAADSKEGGEEVVKKKSRSRSKEKERKRSRTRERKRSRSRSRGQRKKRSRSRGERKRRSRSRERRRSRTRSRDRRRSRSRDHKHKKSKKERKSSKDRDSKKDKEPITRDYDQEEAGYENSKPTKEEKLEAVDMEISNSP